MTRILQPSSVLSSCLLCLWWCSPLVLCNKSINNINDNNGSTPKQQSQSQQQQQKQQQPFQLTSDTFVDDPEAILLLANNNAGTDNNDIMVLQQPLKLIYWSAPQVDWSSTFVLQRLQPIIARFDTDFTTTTTSSSSSSSSEATTTTPPPPPLIKFHPHEAIGDGANPVFGCRTNHNTRTDLTKLSDSCLTDCSNAGRYCALPSISNNNHEGLTGADIIQEQVRRSCLWMLYGQHATTRYKYFQYLFQIRDTHCDESFSDGCLEHVYRQVDIDANDLSSCIHDAGGIGSQIDTKNMILKEELHRMEALEEERHSNDWDSTALTTNAATQLPYLTFDSTGPPLQNITTKSDWQLLADICTALGQIIAEDGKKSPPPPVCDFCLLECPQNNNNRDPTQQCLWDLTCGNTNDDGDAIPQDEIRTFHEWFHNTGVFANRTITTNDSGSGATQNEENKDDSNEHAVPTVPPTKTSIVPTVAPTVDNQDINDSPLEEEDIDDLDMDSNATVSSPPAPTLKPIQHNNGNNHQHPSAAPQGTTTTPPPYYGGTGYSQHGSTSYNSPESTQNDNANKTSTTHHHQSGGTLGTTAVNHQQHKSASNMSSQPTSGVIGGLVVAVCCLMAMIAGVVVFQRWQRSKEYATVIKSAERAEGGLASTASHSLQLDVEMTPTVTAATTKSRKTKSGYSAPGVGGTWG